MRFQVILNILGILLALFSTSLLPPLALSLIYSDNTTTAFLVAYVVTLATGLACYLPTRRQGRDLRLRDGFLIVVLFWTVLATKGAGGQPSGDLAAAIDSDLGGFDAFKMLGHFFSRF